MNWNLKRYFKDQEGATLVELVAAIAILAIVVTSFLSFFIQSAQTTYSSEEITDATYLAQQEMEYLYHLSDTMQVDESIAELTAHSSSTTGNGLERTFTIQSEEIDFTLGMTEVEKETMDDSVLINFILIGREEGKQLIQLESKIPFEKEVENE